MPGQTYLVTTATASREPWFARWPVAIAVARELGGKRLWRDSHNQAWVLMPDHKHVQLTLGKSESLSHLIARVKAVSARAARTATVCRRPFWARAFHDHAVRSDEQAVAAARYIIANPVRAGLVDSLWAWSFWDSQWLPEPGADELYVHRGGRGFRRSYDG
jgi:REP element-mobilizing transposase RayT